MRLTLSEIGIAVPLVHTAMWKKTGFLAMVA